MTATYIYIYYNKKKKKKLFQINIQLLLVPLTARNDIRNRRSHICISIMIVMGI